MHGLNTCGAGNIRVKNRDIRVFLDLSAKNGIYPRFSSFIREKSNISAFFDFYPRKPNIHVSSNDIREKPNTHVYSSYTAINQIPTSSSYISEKTKYPRILEFIRENPRYSQVSKKTNYLPPAL